MEDDSLVNLDIEGLRLMAYIRGADRRGNKEDVIERLYKLDFYIMTSAYDYLPNEELDNFIKVRGIKIPPIRSKEEREYAITLLENYDDPDEGNIDLYTSSGVRSYIYKHNLVGLLISVYDNLSDEQDYLLRAARGIADPDVTLSQLDAAIKERQYDLLTPEALVNTALIRGMGDLVQNKTKDEIINLLKRFDEGEYFPTVSTGIQDYAYFLNHGFKSGDLYDRLSDFQIEVVAGERGFGWQTIEEFIRSLRSLDDLLRVDDKFYDFMTEEEISDAYTRLGIIRRKDLRDDINALKAYGLGGINPAIIRHRFIGIYNYTRKIIDPNTFDNYSNLSESQLRIFYTTRGLGNAYFPNPQIEDKDEMLRELDRAIDSRDYNLGQEELLDLAIARGIIITRDRRGIVNRIKTKLKEYDSGRDYIMGDLTQEGVRRYHYARRRNSTVNTLPKGREITLDTVQSRTINELKAWLQNQGIQSRGAKRKDDYILLVSRALHEIQEAEARDRFISYIDKNIVSYKEKRKNYIPRGAIPIDPIDMSTDIELGAYYRDFILYTPVDILMSGDEARVDVIMEQLGYDKILPFLKTREKINILWWRYALSVRYPDYRYWDGKDPRSLREMPFFKGMSVPSIFFILLHGVKPPTSRLNRNTLNALRNYKPYDIAKISAYIWRYYLNDQTIEPRTPYQLFLSHDISSIYPFIIHWAPDRDKTLSEVDPTNIATSAGMVFPPNLMDGDLRYKNHHFTENILFYQGIFTRPSNTQLPPVLEDFEDKDNALDALRKYTDYELIDTYDIFFDQWFSRPDFLMKIVDAAFNPRWSYKSGKCSNANVENVITLEPRVATNEDPLFSYGTLERYTCYSLEELTHSFREDKDFGFLFTIPSEETAILEFSVDSMKEFKRFLVTEGNPRYLVLINKITEGLIAKRGIKRRFDDIKDIYQRLPQGEQKKVRDYILSLFVMGMTMRFWKGPGNPWPMNWLDRKRYADPDRCDVPTRAVNTTVAFNRLDEILGSMTPEVRDFVLAIPRVRYNFNTNEAAMGKETINHVLELSRTGNFCLADASDQLIGTSYYLVITSLLLSIDDFNLLLSEYLETDQPPFDPTQVTRTMHIDPFERLEIEEY